MPNSILVWKYIFPEGILGAIFIVITSLLQMKSIGTKVKEIQTFTQQVAEKDYTGNELPVTTRNDIGLLINDLNTFKNETHSLLADIKESVKISHNTAENVNSSMTTTSKSIEEIMENINKVKEQTGFQVDCVSNSSSAVEEMVANIRSVTQILEGNSKTQPSF